jgi:Skp family chaperone for outer membrane proteins
MKRYTIAAAAGALLALSATSLAQAQAARPAAPAASQTPPPQGPALPGVCVLSKEGAVYASTVGKAMLARLDQLNSQADAEIKGQQTSLQTDAKTLESQKATLPADQYQQRGQALQVRLNELQKTAQLRNAEMQLTQKKALQTFGTYMDPVVRQVFAQRNCSLLFDGNALIYPAPAMDITPAVIQDLNGKVQSFPFDREHIDPNTGQPAAR